MSGSRLGWSLLLASSLLLGGTTRADLPPGPDPPSPTRPPGPAPRPGPPAPPPAPPEEPGCAQAAEGSPLVVALLVGTGLVVLLGARALAARPVSEVPS